MRSDRKRGDQDTYQKSHVDQKYGGSAINMFPLYDMDLLHWAEDHSEEAAKGNLHSMLIYSSEFTVW